MTRSTTPGRANTSAGVAITPAIRSSISRSVAICCPTENDAALALWKMASSRAC